jgi:hypothetical protein
MGEKFSDVELNKVSRERERAAPWWSIVQAWEPEGAIDAQL